MNQKQYFTSFLLIVTIIMSGCAPSVEQSATMTASVWTATSTVTLTFTPTKTPTPTAIPTETPTATPLPVAVVSSDFLNVREGPGAEYRKLGNLRKNEEIDIIGQFKDCNWLKVSSRNQSMIGWVSGDKRYIESYATCENIPLGTFRSLTSMISPKQLGGGSGKLTIDNKTTKDSVVILTLSDYPVMASYIRSGESFTMNGIPDDTYHLYFSTGYVWNGKAFTVTPSHQKFEDDFEFTTTGYNLWPYSSTIYTVWSVTLNSVEGGNASAAEVDESEFPNIDRDLPHLPETSIIPIPSSSQTPTSIISIQPTIDLLCKDTYDMVGKTVNCKIPNAYCSYQSTSSGKPTFCNDAPYPNHSFILVIWGSDWSDLDKQCIYVSGIVTLYDGKPQIEATNRSQITSCN